MTSYIYNNLSKLKEKISGSDKLSRNKKNIFYTEIDNIKNRLKDTEMRGGSYNIHDSVQKYEKYLPDSIKNMKKDPRLDTFFKDSNMADIYYKTNQMNMLYQALKTQNKKSGKNDRKKLSEADLDYSLSSPHLSDYNWGDIDSSDSSEKIKLSLSDSPGPKRIRYIKDSKLTKKHFNRYPEIDSSDEYIYDLEESYSPDGKRVVVESDYIQLKDELKKVKKDIKKLKKKKPINKKLKKNKKKK